MPLVPLLTRERLGEVLVRQGRITVAQLAEALDYQREHGGRLGEILVQKGFVDAEALAQALAAHLGVPYWDLRTQQPDPDAARLVPEWLARRHRVVPVRQEHGVLWVAMADPTDVQALEDIRLLTGLRVQAVLAVEEEVLAAIQRLFGVVRTAERVAAVVPADTSREAPAQQVGLEAEGPVVTLVQNLLALALRDGASDVHIEPLPDHMRVRLRVDGLLREMTRQPLQLIGPVISHIKVLAGMDIAERRLPQDGRFTARVDGQLCDVRVSTIPTVHGEKAVLRVLNKSAGVPALGELGLAPEVLSQWVTLLARPWGLLLVTGPTGSGKSTTLAASLKHLNDETRNIVTVEDPIEYELPGVHQTQVNHRAGYTFGVALRHFLRQDPDVIMVGEIRDRETAEMAVQAALTGHLVLTTLHTGDAASAVVRLAEMGVEPFLVAACVVGVLNQRLVRVLCPCRQPYRPAAETVARLGLPPSPPARYCQPVGCRGCHGGYRGRRAVGELLVVTERIRELITRGADAAAIRQAAVAEGMRPLMDACRDLAAAGVTAIEEVLRVAGT